MNLTIFSSLRKSALKSSLLILLLAILTTDTFGQTIIAQQTDIIPGSYISLDNYYFTMIGPPTLEYQDVGQIFKATATINLASIAFNLQQLDQPGTVNIQIYSCADRLTWGTLLGTQTNVAINSTGWTTSDVSALNIDITNGNYYGFRLIPQLGLSSGIGGGGTYMDGASWASNGSGPGSFVGFNYAFTVTGGVPLPVTLVSFTAELQDKDVLLKWRTASEQNSKDFIIQHSNDGSNWQDIHTVAATGNSNTLTSYSFTDASPSPGINYYRLLETDIDGKTSYSKISAVNLTSNTQEFALVGNPVANGLLWVQVNQATTLSLYNASGQRIWVKQFGAGMQTISVSGFAKGVYLLKGKQATATVLVQ